MLDFLHRPGVRLGVMPSTRSTASLQVAFIAAAALAVVGFVAWKAWDAQEKTLAGTAIDATNLARSLSEHASRTFGEVDLALADVVERVQNGGLEPDQIDRTRRLMAERARSTPQIRELVVLDDQGLWKATSQAYLPAHSNDDRDYFKAHRADPSQDVRINLPVMSRNTNRLSILLTRRVSRADGSFAGVVVAAIDASYFQKIYDSFDIGAHGGITLLRRDGTVLIRRPIADVVRSSVTSSRLFEDMNEKPSGYYRAISAFDGLAKVIAFVRVAEYPVVTVVALSEEEALAHWRRQLLADLAVTGVLLAILIGLGFALVHQTRQREAMQRDLLESEQRYRLIADNAGDVVGVFDFDGNRHYISPSIKDVLGWSPEERIASSLFDSAHPGQHRYLRAAFAMLKDGCENQRVEYQVLTKAGNYLWVETTFKLVRDSDTQKPASVIGTLRDISKRKAIEDQLHAANTRLQTVAATDFLTGIPNRRSFDIALEREWSHAMDRGLPLSVMMIDVDLFKKYNDHFGHAAGDECLIGIAAVLRNALPRPADTACRYGGEEFAIILPNTDQAEAKAVAQAIREKVHALRIEHPHQKEGIVTLSIGVCCTEQLETPDMASLVKCADLALYNAKRGGRDTIACWAAEPRHRGVLAG
jgi:diguanylate cyclase (GGDEF)-like protein/PAS domain S-box-containing protein